MAKIMGLELKKVVKFPGHEGEECIHASIALEGKIVGTVTEDTWGGENQYHFISEEGKARVNDISARYFAKYPNYLGVDGLDILVYEIRSLETTEKDFKKWLKKLTKYVGVPGYSPGILVHYFDKTDQVKSTFCYSTQKHLDEYLNKEQPVSYKVYKDLGDFIIE